MLKFETCQKIQERGLIDNLEPEYWYHNIEIEYCDWDCYPLGLSDEPEMDVDSWYEIKNFVSEMKRQWKGWVVFCKALTTEEAIELLLQNITNSDNLELWRDTKALTISGNVVFAVDWENVKLHDAMDQIWNYVLDNNII